MTLYPKEHISLARYTSLNLGGYAEYFIEVPSKDVFLKAVAWAGERKIPVTILGGGKNTLVADAGIQGLVLRMAMRGLTISGCEVTAEAGVVLGVLAQHTARAGLAGLEWTCGVPGTVGGAVRGNAGAFGGEIRDTLVSVEAWDGSTLRTLTNAAWGFSYRESFFKTDEGRGSVILSAKFSLRAEDAKTCGVRVKELSQKKTASQPLQSVTAGCTFKNIRFAKPDPLWTKKIPRRFLDAGVIPAGWLIDEVGLKGKKIGGISISDRHGNFFLNDGTGTADEMVQLISMAKMRVRDQFGIQLQEEIQLLGFE